MFLLITTLVCSIAHNNSVYNRKAGDSNQMLDSGDLFSDFHIAPHHPTRTVSSKRPIWVFNIYDIKKTDYYSLGSQQIYLFLYTLLLQLVTM